MPPCKKADFKKLPTLLNKRVTIFCNGLIYRGVIIDYNKKYITLERPRIFQERSDFIKIGLVDIDASPSKWYVLLKSIQAIGAS